MKKNLSTNRIRNCIVVITTALLYSIQLFADVEDHGRWYSIDDSSSDLSIIEVIICSTILLLVSLLFIAINKDKDGNRNDFWMGIIGVATVICVLLYKCS